jgi:alginate O-acetyltransferase complex protein AlgI
MIFTSYTYVAFLMAAFVLHWSLPRSWRKPLLILASYAFYCSWKWQYGFLLLGLSLFNWAYGRWVMARPSGARWLPLGIVTNLAPLLYFKYAHFLAANSASLLQLFGGPGQLEIPSIVLPLGISFFTFQGMAYLIDVAAGDAPFPRLIDFLLYKGFWPQLLAGPIIRPAEIRDQILGDRTLRYADVACGGRRILSGLFKKVVLADTLAPFVDSVFVAGASPNAVDSVVGTLAFGLQIYLDFSAYSEIAIGSARLFGFVFPENFRWPYAAGSPREFWNRWHMTLSRWIRDYLFTPMSFSLRSRPRLVPLAVLAAMAICGLWHGAAWTFVLWGLWHGVLLILGQVAGRVFGPAAGRPAGRAGRARSFLGWTLTFSAVTAGWALFRAPSVAAAWNILASVLTWKGGLRPAILRENAVLFVLVLFLALLAAQFGSRALRARLERVRHAGLALRIARPVVYTLLILSVIVFDKAARAFVYFQF